VFFYDNHFYKLILDHIYHNFWRCLDLVLGSIYFSVYNLRSSNFLTVNHSNVATTSSISDRSSNARLVAVDHECSLDSNPTTTTTTDYYMSQPNKLASEKKENRISWMLIAVVITFLVCNCLALVGTLLEQLIQMDEYYDYMRVSIVSNVFSNEYNRNAGMTVDRCGLLISITSKISSLVFRFSLLILEAARRLIREWQCRSIQVSHTYPQSGLHSCYTHLKCNRL